MKIYFLKYVLNKPDVKFEKKKKKTIICLRHKNGNHSLNKKTQLTDASTIMNQMSESYNKNFNAGYKLYNWF